MTLRTGVSNDIWASTQVEVVLELRAEDDERSHRGHQVAGSHYG